MQGPPAITVQQPDNSKNDDIAAEQKAKDDEIAALKKKI